MTRSLPPKSGALAASLFILSINIAEAASVVDNLLPTGITHTAATLGGKVVTLDGTAPTLTVYYGTTDGGTAAGNWAKNLSLGYTLTQETKTVTGLLPGTTYYFRIFGSGATGTDWADASGTFATPAPALATVENRNADDVSATSAQLRGEITSDGGQATSITIFWGPTDGGTTPGNWQFSRALGPQTGSFDTLVIGLTAQSTYRFRCRATNASGESWAPDTESFVTASTVPETVVINEINYDPADPTKFEEFIEFHNPTAIPIDMSGWVIDKGVDFVFPGGTVIPAGGFRVVAENVAAFTAAFPGAGTPLGPWQAGDRLSNNGETIRLKDSLGNVVDEVDYKAGFPWPTSANGGGSSIELIHPYLSNDLGGNWRSSVSLPDTVILPRGASGWRYRETRSDPPATWKQLSFDDSSPAAPEWLACTLPAGFQLSTPFNPAVTFGTTVGYGGNTADKTRTYYFRKKFNLAAPAALTLNIRRDDGAVAWVNDDASPTVISADTAWNPPFTYATLAPNATTAVDGLSNYAKFTIPASKLVAGDNVLALELHQSSISSSDLLLDAELVISSPKGGTPGGANSTIAPTASAAPPAIRGVAHTPQQPATGNPVVITATVTDPDGVGAVTLDYQTVDPGGYIRKTDASYATAWTALAMKDDGTGGDAIAGDSVYTATLSGALQTHRRLVRYRITAADSLTNNVRVPYADDEQPNFAYFCHDGIPGWSGAFNPGSTPVQNFPASVLQSIPTYHLIANEADVLSTQYNPSTPDTQRFLGTIVYDGVVYDHINYHIRGIGSTRVSGKNKWSFLFNRSRDFEARDNWGRKYAESWNSVKIGANASPWCAVHRGMAGVEEAASQRLFELAGVPSARTHYFALRIIRRATESNPAGQTVTDPLGPSGSLDGQYSNDLWGLYLAIEPLEGNFLNERSLPDGNVCSIEGGNADTKHQGATQPPGATDYATFKTGFNLGNQTIGWYQANMDLDVLYSWLGVSRLCGNVDVRPGDNFFYYHRSSDNRWVLMPYDLDMMFLPAHHWGTNTIIDGELPTNTNPAGYDFTGANFAGVPETYRTITRHPALALESRNKARELLDLLASDATANGGQMGQLIDEYGQIVNPTGAPLTWADIDNAMWNAHPRTTASGSVQTNHRLNFLRATYNDARGNLNGITQTSYTRTHADPNGDGFAEFEEKLKYLTEYATNAWPGGTWTRSNGNQRGYGYKYLEWESLYSGLATHQSTQPSLIDQDFPNTPGITAVGTPGFPANDLKFRSGNYSDPQGAATIAAVQWRIGEISAPGMAFYDPAAPRKYEIETVWTSGELPQAAPTGIPDVRIPASSVRAGHTYRARVRHKDNTGRWSHWSAPVQFAVALPDVTVYQNDLAITEIMYQPPLPNSAETTAGFGREDFEFVELQNIGAAPLDLTDVRFTKGVDFDFVPGTTVAAGAKIYVVKNPAAFALRYGAGRVVAGSYGTDNLSNNGEQLKLSYGTGTPIHDLTYSDASPWPVSADGHGYSIQLIDPGSHPDHALPQNWRAGITMTDWRRTNALADGGPGTGDDEDFDNDGISNRMEYALAGDPAVASAAPWPVGGLTVDNFMTLTFTRQTGPSDVAYAVEFSTDLAVWTGNAVLLDSMDNGNGTTTQIWRAPVSIPAGQRLYGRLKIQ